MLPWCNMQAGHPTLSGDLLAAACRLRADRGKLLAGDRVRNSQAGTAFGTTTGQNLAAVGGRHALTETMLVDAFAV